MEVDEISPPVTTRFGIHLIKSLEIRPGKIGWRDAIDEVREHAARTLFEQIANEYRDNVTIELNVVTDQQPKTK